MKQSAVIVFFFAVFLVGPAAQAAAELTSLRGAEPVPATVQAPQFEKFIKDKENVDRTFEEQPPVVPHENEKYAINLKENKCLECHMKQEGKQEAKSVEMSDSHFTDRSGTKLDKPSAGRHFCTQCHVPQVDRMPLIGTSFQAAK